MFLGPLPLGIGLLLTALAILVLHWCPPLFIRWRLSPPAAYILGVVTVGSFLTWHQLTNVPMWWHYWAFYAAGGGADILAYAIDRWILKDRLQRVEAGIHERRSQREPATVAYLKAQIDRQKETQAE